MILPADILQQFAYDKYCSASTSEKYDVANFMMCGMTTSHTFQHPSHRHCYTCQSNAMSLPNSIALTEEEKVKLPQDRLKQAKAERDYYKQQDEAAIKANECAEPHLFL